jgi:hypothetical protein
MGPMPARNARLDAIQMTHSRSVTLEWEQQGGELLAVQYAPSAKRRLLTVVALVVTAATGASLTRIRPTPQGLCGVTDRPGVHS